MNIGTRVYWDASVFHELRFEMKKKPLPAFRLVKLPHKRHLGPSPKRCREGKSGALPLFLDYTQAGSLSASGRLCRKAITSCGTSCFLHCVPYL